MSEKELNNNKTKRQHSPNLVAKKPSQQLPPAAVIQKARFGSLTPYDIKNLRGVVGNQGIIQLVAKQDRQSEKSKPAASTEASRPNTSTTSEKVVSSEVTPQSEAGNIPSAVAIMAEAPLVNDARYLENIEFEYQAIIDAVQDYHKVCNNAYGRRIFILNKIRDYIMIWERKHGLTSQAITTSLPQYKFLQALKKQVEKEDREVRKEGQEQANKNHKKDGEWLRQCVEEGLKSDDLRLRNSCEWIKSGKALLYAVTPTGDSYVRVKAAGEDPRRNKAYFPTGLAVPMEVVKVSGDIYSSPVTYNAYDLMDNSNVRICSPFGGWNDGGNPKFIGIVCPAKRSMRLVWEIIKHEVQHAADKRKERYNFAGVRQAAETFDKIGPYSFSVELDFADELDKSKVSARWHEQFQKNGVPLTSSAFVVKGWIGGDWTIMDGCRRYLIRSENQRLNVYIGLNYSQDKTKDEGLKSLEIISTELLLASYKTEFHAYSFDGSYTYLDNKSQNKKYQGLKLSARQRAILKKVTTGDLYPHIKKAWKDNPKLADGASFREAVASYWGLDAEGFNKYNSIRVDDFFLALDVVGDKEINTQWEYAYGVDASPVKAATDPKDPKVKALMNTIPKLWPEEAAYIISEKEENEKKKKTAMMNKIEKHLAGEAREKIIDELNKRANESGIPTNSK